jgi:hypothetical protein
LSTYIFGGSNVGVPKILSLAILSLGCSLLILAVVGTFNHEYDYTRRVTGSSEETPIGLANVRNLKGNIISVQVDDTNKPLWILSGKWRIDDLSENETSNNASGLKLGANITMVGTNGTEEHKHKLINFTVTNITFSNRQAIMKGIGSLQTEKEQIGIPASIANIPITVKIENLRTIAIDIDRDVSNHHFADTSIFGSVTGKSSD